MTKENKICVGVITGAHGINGAVKVKSFTANPSDVASYGLVEDDSGKVLSLKILGENKDFVRVRIEGVNNRNEAEALKNIKLFVNRDALPETEEEEFYHADLIGLDAIFEDGEFVGKLSAIYNFGAGDVLEIKNDTKVFMVPFTKKAGCHVDLKNKTIAIVKDAIIDDSSQEKVEEEL